MLGRRRKRHTDQTRPDLPITPMLDMSFQLMAFFILTFRPAPTEAQLPLALPPAEGGPAAVAPPPADLNLPDEDDLTVQVYDGPGGLVGRIVVARATGEENVADTSALFQYLKAAVAKRPAKPPKLKLEVAPDLNYQFVVKIIDEAKRAGVNSVSPTMIGAKKG
jgi:biopolymer transport protein ExbD